MIIKGCFEEELKQRWYNNSMNKLVVNDSLDENATGALLMMIDAASNFTYTIVDLNNLGSMRVI